MKSKPVKTLYDLLVQTSSFVSCFSLPFVCTDARVSIHYTAWDFRSNLSAVHTHLSFLYFFLFIRLRIRGASAY